MGRALYKYPEYMFLIVLCQNKGTWTISKNFKLPFGYMGKFTGVKNLCSFSHLNHYNKHILNFDHFWRDYFILWDKIYNIFKNWFLQ